MKVYNVISNQSIFDLAVQLYGDESFAFKILEDNPYLGNLNKGLVRGQKIKYEPVQSQETQFWIDKNRDISTSQAGISGKGYKQTAFKSTAYK